MRLAGRQADRQAGRQAGRQASRPAGYTGLARTPASLPHPFGQGDRVFKVKLRENVCGRRGVNGRVSIGRIPSFSLHYCVCQSTEGVVVP